MICIAPRLPSIQFGHQTAARYNTAWIAEAISHAAAEAGHPGWVFSQDIARGVMEYLSEKFPGQQISLHDLNLKVVRTLETVGFPDIASRLTITPPPVEISLATLARDASPGFELLFFQSLDHQIHRATRDGATTVRFTGLRPAVDALVDPPRPRHRRRTNRDPRPQADALHGEILEFIRRRASHHALSVVIR